MGKVDTVCAGMLIIARTWRKVMGVECDLAVGTSSSVKTLLVSFLRRIIVGETGD